VMFLPIIVIAVLLIKGYSALLTAFIGTLSILVFTSLYAETRFKLKNILHALETSAMGILQILSICACAGIVVSLVFLSGLGLKIPSLIRFISQGNVVITLVIAMIGALILGCGLPTTAGYIILATLGASALTDVGITPLAAHLFILYFVVINNVTPPVALAAYSASAIAKSDPVKTAYLAFKFAIAGFIVPYAFVFGPVLLMQGSWLHIIWGVITSMLGIIALAASAIGYLIKDLGIVKRVLFFIVALVLIEQSLWSDLAGIGILTAIFCYDKVMGKRLKSIPSKL